MYTGEIYTLYGHLHTHATPFRIKLKENRQIEFISTSEKKLNNLPDISCVSAFQGDTLSKDFEINLFSERMLYWSEKFLAKATIKEAYYENQPFFYIYAPQIDIMYDSKNEKIGKIDKAKSYLKEDDHIFRIKVINGSLDRFDSISESFVKHLEKGNERYKMTGFRILKKE